jgi:hypothetical protein
MTGTWPMDDLLMALLIVLMSALTYAFLALSERLS